MEQESAVRGGGVSHTPGPWVASEQRARDGRLLGWIVEAKHREGFGHRGVPAWSRIGWPSLAWADTNEGAPSDHPENVANARLIAAAPDLLAVAERALAWLGDVTEEEDPSGVKQALANAIRKARGETNDATDPESEVSTSLSEEV